MSATDYLAISAGMLGATLLLTAFSIWVLLT